MMSTQQIRSMSAKAARESAARGITPLLFEQDDLGDDIINHTRAIPFIGDRVPRGELPGHRLCGRSRQAWRWCRFRGFAVSA